MVIATYRSLAEPDALAALVRERYGLPVESCALVRSLTNDVYVAKAEAERFVLKVYGPGGWSLDEVRWEQDLACHLADAGVAITRPVALANGELAGSLDAAEGPRPFALFRFIDGDKPRMPFDDALYRGLGTLIGNLHVTGLTFRSERPRRAADLRAALDDPLAVVLPALDDQPDDRRLVETMAREAHARLEPLMVDGLVWGTRHGDVSPHNILRGPDGLVLHDLDQAGPGWLAADLTGVWAFDHWDAFRAGYERVRPLAAAELAAIFWLDVVARIGNLAFHLVEKPAVQGTESLSEGWVDRELAALREAAAAST